MSMMLVLIHSMKTIETVPVYTRNNNLTLTMSTDYNAPLTLRSMTWEGDITDHTINVSNYIHPCTLEAAYHVASNLRQEDLERW